LAEKVPLDEVDAAVAEDGVGSRDVEVDIGNDDLQKVVFAVDHLLGLLRHRDFALSRAFAFFDFYALRECNRLYEPSAKLFERLLVVFMFRRKLAEKPSGSRFNTAKPHLAENCLESHKQNI
jgi:hypothetical protein